MIITYRRTGGLFMLFTVAATALAATAVGLAVAAIVLIVAVAGGAAALLVRAVVPRSWRGRAVAPPTSPPLEIIDGTIVNTAEDKE
jgi:hypothetical protein